MTNGSSDVQLLISLGVDDRSSRSNISKYVQNLKTENLDVTLNVTGNSSNNQVFKNMEKQIEDLQGKVKELNNLLDNVGKGNNSPTSSKASRIISDLKHEQDQIRQFLKTTYNTDSFNFKVNVDTSSGQKVLKGFVADIRDVNGEIQKFKFDANFKQIGTVLNDNHLKSYKTSLEAVNKSLDSAREKSLLTTKEIQKFKNQLDSIKTDELNVDKSGSFNKLKRDIEQTISSTRQFNKVTDDINEALVSMGRNGSLSGERLGDLVSKVSRINSMDITLDEKIVKLRKELSKLNNEFDDVSHTNKMTKAMEQAKRSVQDLESSFLKTNNQYKRITSSMDLSGYKRQLQELSAIPVFRNQRDIDLFNARLREAQSEMRRFSADVTQANRNSQTLWSQLATAMTRFPIWIDMLVQNKLF